MTAADPTTRRLAAQIAAHASWSNTSDRKARTGNARAALQARFEAEVDPHGLLDPEELAVRVGHAKSAYYARLALKSHANRRKAAQLLAEADAADAEADQTA